MITAETRAEIIRQKERYPQARSAVLPALWALQHQAGYLPVEGMRDVAEVLGLAPSEVQAVAGFYSMYFDKPVGDHSVLVCINVSCALRGSDAIVEHLEKRLGCASGSTSADGAFTWQATVECLGACGGAPAMQIDHHFHEELTPARVDAILDEYRGASAPGHGAEVNQHSASAATPAAAAAKKNPSKSAKRPRLNADDL